MPPSSTELCEVEIEEAGPSLRTTFRCVGLWGRGMALFVGAFTLLNLLGELRYPGFDANLWWIDLRALDARLANGFLTLSAVLLLGYAFWPTMRPWRRSITFFCVLLLYVACIFNVVTFYILLAQHRIEAGIPVPFSLLVSMAF